MSKGKTNKALTKSDEKLSDNLASEGREVAERIVDLHRREKLAEGNLLLIRIEMGRQLQTFKLKVVKPRQFTHWVRCTCPMDLRTAERSMALWRALGEKTTLVSKLGLKSGYLLSERKTPAVARTRIFERFEAGEVLGFEEISRIIENAKKELTEAQKRREEGEATKEGAQTEEGTETAGAGRKNDGSEKTVTEPRTVDGAANGTEPTSQDNAAGAGNDDSAGEPTGGCPAIEGTAEPAHTETPRYDTGDPEDPVSPLPSEEAGEELSLGAEAAKRDSGSKQEDDASDGRSAEAEVNAPSSPGANGDGPEPTREAEDSGSNPGSVHEHGPAEETATASPNAAHSFGERGSKTKKRRERQPELFDEASRRDLPRLVQTGEDTAFLRTVDENPNAAHEVSTSTGEATGENYAPPDAAAEQTAAAEQNRDAQVAASDVAIQSDAGTDAEPGGGYPYMLFVEMLHPPPDGDINKYPPADWAEIQLSIRELRGAIGRCGHLARLFAVPR